MKTNYVEALSTKIKNQNSNINAQKLFPLLILCTSKGTSFLRMLIRHLSGREPPKEEWQDRELGNF